MPDNNSNNSNNNVQQNWLDSMSSTQRFILQMGMAGVVIIFLFLIWYAFRQVTQEEITMLKEQIQEVKQTSSKSSEAHGKALDTVVKMAEEQRNHDATEREATRRAMQALADAVKPKYDAFPAIPAPKKE